MVRRAWRQECGAMGHIVSTVRKQTQMNVSIPIATWRLALYLLSPFYSFWNSSPWTGAAHNQGWVFLPQWAQKFSHWHMNRTVPWVILDHVGLTISISHRCSGGLNHRTAFWSPATYLKVYSRARGNTARQEASMRGRIRASFLKQHSQGNWGDCFVSKVFTLQT